jgi:phage shock protein C
MIGGVCGGLADYFNLDPTLIRALFILMAFTPLHGILVYIILWIITPPESRAAVLPTSVSDTPQSGL